MERLDQSSSTSVSLVDGCDSCDTQRELDSDGDSYADTVVRGGIQRDA